MSDPNANFGFIKTNEHAGINEASRNAWVVGISTSHPGQKYYFNTITGVSLWNISIEEMEKSQQHMKSNGSQSQYVNCPEPKEPPPNRKVLGKQTQHSAQCPQLLNRHINNGFSKHLSGLPSETSHNPVNQLTLNIRPCPHPQCISPLNSGPQSPINSCVVPSSLDTLYCNSNSNHLGRKRSYNSGDPEGTRYQDHKYNHSGNENEWPDTNRSIEVLDVSALKMLAKSGTIEHKWYIVADVSVFLDSIHFLKTILNSDHRCCLMVPRNVKIELESVTKNTQLRTKAYYAIHFIYKMIDCGVAVIDDDILDTNQDKSDRDNVIDCCAKLNKHNYYVVLISNDLDLKKYIRYKINIPNFTVKELKLYLCKPNLAIPTSPKQVSMIPHKNKNIVSDNTNLIHNACMANLNIVVKKNQNTQTSLDFTEKATQIDTQQILKKNVQVQTDPCASKLESMESINKNQNNDCSTEREKSFGYCQSCKQPICNTNVGPRKQVKLRRRKVDNHSVLTDLTSKTKSALVDVSSKIDDNVSKTVRKSLWSKGETVTENLSKNFCDISMKISEVNKSGDQNQNQSQNENKNVMFEITNTVMEQNLKVKCDEWVSRFVQIMEEALTQVLRKNSSLYLPPPWNMYEATMCIGQKYKEDTDVADACSKLLNVLNCISALKGNSNINISPTKYMEMYSYGVYLIDALQGILSTCEDLQIAAESLSKLLSDIQNPELEHSALELFQDLSYEDHMPDYGECARNNIKILRDPQKFAVDRVDLPNNVEELNEDSRAITEDTEILSNRSEKSKSSLSPTEWSNINTQTENTIVENFEKSKAVNIARNNSVACTEIPQGSQKSTPASSPSSYNLKSIQKERVFQKKQDEEHLHRELVQQSRRKSLFLSVLLLQRNKDTAERYVHENLTHDVLSFQNTTIDEKSCNEVKYSVFNGLDETSHTSNKPKIVRNFVMCSEFEERLRNHEIQNEYDEFHFENEEMEIDYNYDDDCSSDNRKLDIDKFSEYHSDSNILCQPLGLDHEAEQNKDGIKISFKSFIQRIAQEIKDISAIVYDFGKKYCEELSSLSESANEKSEVREKAEQAYLYVDKLCTSLTSLLCRDKDFNYNLEAVLRNTEFGDLSVVEDQMNIYGSFIERCLDQARCLKVPLEEIISSISK